MQLNLVIILRCKLRYDEQVRLVFASLPAYDKTIHPGEKEIEERKVEINLFLKAYEEHALKFVQYAPNVISVYGKLKQQPSMLKTIIAYGEQLDKFQADWQKQKEEKLKQELNKN